jgi:hypothetical protein
MVSEWWFEKGCNEAVGIFLEELRKTTKNLSQDSRTPGQIWTRYLPDAFVS